MGRWRAELYAASVIFLALFSPYVLSSTSKRLQWADVVDKAQQHSHAKHQLVSDSEAEEAVADAFRHSPIDMEFYRSALPSVVAPSRIHAMQNNRADGPTMRANAAAVLLEEATKKLALERRLESREIGALARIDLSQSQIPEVKNVMAMLNVGPTTMAHSFIGGPPRFGRRRDRGGFGRGPFGGGGGGGGGFPFGFGPGRTGRFGDNGRFPFGNFDRFGPPRRPFVPPTRPQPTPPAPPITEPRCQNVANVNRYRTPDGSCNHPAKAQLGQARTPFSRELGLTSHYDDGISQPRQHVYLYRGTQPTRPNPTGAALPNAREISNIVHGTGSSQLYDPRLTHMLMQWGQFLDHDFVFTPNFADESSGPNSLPAARSCVENGRPVAHPECIPICGQTGETDPTKRCIDLRRSAAGQTTLGPREQTNGNTHFLDGSHIYGSSVEEQRALRTFSGGLMKTQRIQNREQLPSQSQAGIRSPDSCAAPGDQNCFVAGDGRARENPGLTTLHVLFVREHNRIAKQLARFNPRWSDTQLFEEARKIIVAVQQHITYSHWLPLVVGPYFTRLYELDSIGSGFDKYDPNVDPSIGNAFGAAAYRFGHSLVNDQFLLTTMGGFSGENGQVDLASNFFFNGHPVVGAGDSMLRGLCRQAMQRMDAKMVDGLRERLFSTTNFFGSDLAARNIQRGREQGVAGYRFFVHACRRDVISRTRRVNRLSRSQAEREADRYFPRGSGWGDLTRVMDSPSVVRLQTAYGRSLTPWDIDLFPGGLSERGGANSPSSNQLGVVGPTFACIIAEQFSRLKRGDRFFYTNGPVNFGMNGFSRCQLREIRKMTLARMLCDNTDTYNTHPNVFLQPSIDAANNPVSCASLPAMNLAFWSDTSNAIC